MRQAIKRKPGRGRVSRTVSLPAPIGGWNARDSLADMAPTDAVSLINWFPGTSDVMMRWGHSHYCTGLVNQVESLFEYSGGATNTLFAAAGTSIFNVTAGGAVGAAVVTGLTNARFKSVNVATSGGNFMLNVNGADKLRGWNGTAWWTDGDATHDITGFDTATATDITVFKNRVWMIQANSLNAWYLGTSSIAGAASQFPLQSIAREGGHLVAMGTWTIDAGYGVDDMLVFVTSNGEIIVYRGTDPASASTWALAGIWKVGSPVGSNCLFKYAGDLLLISQDGLMPLSAGLQSSRLNPKVSLTDKIQWAVSSAVTSYGANYGWQTIYFPKQNMIILNVPVATGSSQEQYVMNTITKNWGRFKGWDANCWILFNDSLYFGGNGNVSKAWDTYADNGSNIQAEGAQAFNYFGNQGAQKRFTMMRPMLLSSGIPAIDAKINVDFLTNSSYSPLTVPVSTYGTWDSALWDAAIWADALGIIRIWLGISGVGYSGAPELEVASNSSETHWVSTDIVFEEGGTL